VISASRVLPLAASLAVSLALEAAAAEPPRPAPRTDAQRLERGEVLRASAAAALRHAEGLMADARAEKDLVRVNCLEEKLARAAALAAGAERAARSLREAVARRLEGADVELAALELAGIRAVEVRAAAGRCIGALEHAADGTRVEVVAPPRTEKKK